MKNKTNFEEILIREPSKEEFLKAAEFSFENFVNETAKSTGEPVSELKTKLGGPPTNSGPNDIWFVIKNSAKQVGFIWIQLIPNKKTAFGYDIFLEPEFRSQGIGRHVMQFCGGKLKLRGIESVEICVFEHNTIARSLYESLGFVLKKFDESRKQFTLSLRLS